MPDGKLLFTTDAFSFVFNGDGQARVRQLYTVSSGGGLPVKLPVPYGADGAISSDGQWLAYTFYAPTTPLCRWTGATFSSAYSQPK